MLGSSLLLCPFPRHTQQTTTRQAAVVLLRQRLAAQAPALEPPLDYRLPPALYKPQDALAVMATYSPAARQTAALLEATDCVYCASYCLVLASLLGLAVRLLKAPEALHAVNLVPLAAALADIVENGMMLELLRAPRQPALAAAVARASAVKWALLATTGSEVVTVGGLALLRAAGKKAGGKKAGGKRE